MRLAPQQQAKSETVDSGIMGDRLLKVAEVGQLLGYSRATVYRLIGEGRLPIVRVAGTIRFRYQSILKWMADHETPPTDSVRTNVE